MSTTTTASSTSQATQQMATAHGLLATGLTVTSTSTASLNGTYRCEGLALEGLQAEAIAVLQNETFADGTTALNWPDKSGAGHSFNIAQFKTLVTAVTLFVAQCAQYAAGLTTTAPSTTATIP